MARRLWKYGWELFGIYFGFLPQYPPLCTTDLVTVFGMAEPLSHKLFQEYTPTQMHPEGLKRLIACYPNGLEWIKEVY